MALWNGPNESLCGLRSLLDDEQVYEVTGMCAVVITCKVRAVVVQTVRSWCGRLSVRPVVYNIL